MKDRTPLSPANAGYLEELYRRFHRAPESVEPGWRGLFERLDSEPAGGESAGAATDNGRSRDAVAAARLIAAYRQWGHTIADLDPLGLSRAPMPPALEPAAYGFGDGDHEQPLDLDGALGLERPSLGALVGRLRATYCGTLAVEFTHVTDPAPRAWLQEAFESGRGPPAAQERVRAAERIMEADELERFMQRRFPGTKRFGAEGAESLLALLDRVLVRSAELGVREVLMSGTSRARLNLMANILGAPLPDLFAAFAGRPALDPRACSGDVVYHLGCAAERVLADHTLRLSWAPNPSHLEAVDAVLLGSVRARQDAHPDRRRAQARVLGILVHTDAAFAGQGVIAETFQLGGLDAYDGGGTIHLVVNNQIGFTTRPRDARTSAYCSDAAKIVEAPVLHVNGDDADAVVRAGALAAEFRHRFRRDVVVDLVCYRRRGHNELDEPSFTQPRMYRAIERHPSVREIYLERLQSAGVLSGDRVRTITAAYRRRLEAGLQAASRPGRNAPVWGERDPQTAPSSRTGPGAPDAATGVPLARLRGVGAALAAPPAHLSTHPKLRRLFAARRAMLETEAGINWAMAEGLALGSLLCEGVPVRMSGQDTARGAFTQRHCVLFDREAETSYVPLNHIRADQARLAVIDSPLAEYATLGFEYGYSLGAPRTLVLWEAQFGDFANVAQVIVDQFIAGGEDKWLQRSGIVLLLPHALEGDGPDHSSARLERFLQLCGRDNLRVVYPTTPANYFHALRRQAKQTPRKPLVVMTPKSLLRHGEAVSALADMGPAAAFRPVLPDPSGIHAGGVRRVVLCSGKVFYDLEAERRTLGVRHTALVRLEQLYPFPGEALAETLAPFRAAELVWCQEEPRNMGAWGYIDRRIEATLRAIGSSSPWPRYAGRAEGASPAEGTLEAHRSAQTALVRAALGACGVSTG